VYGLPLGPAVIIIGTLIWTLAELVGAPAIFSYPAMAGPAHLTGRYVGSFQFMFGLGVALGPMVGGLLFAQIGHSVWLVMGLAGLAVTFLGVAAIRVPAKGTEEPAAAEPAADVPGDQGDPAPVAAGAVAQEAK
jgi:MFS family permease